MNRLHGHDTHILHELNDIGGRWQKPGTLTLNLPLPRQEIASRCRQLHQLGYLDRGDGAGYRINDSGRRALRENSDY